MLIAAAAAGPAAAAMESRRGSAGRQSCGRRGDRHSRARRATPSRPPATCARRRAAGRGRRRGRSPPPRWCAPPARSRPPVGHRPARQPDRRARCGGRQRACRGRGGGATAWGADEGWWPVAAAAHAASLTHPARQRRSGAPPRPSARAWPPARGLHAGGRHGHTTGKKNEADAPKGAFNGKLTDLYEIWLGAGALVEFQLNEHEDRHENNFSKGSRPARP